MTTKKNLSGSITVSDVIDNQFVKKIYTGYTIAQAKTKFKQEFLSNKPVTQFGKIPDSVGFSRLG